MFAIRTCGATEILRRDFGKAQITVPGFLNWIVIALPRVRLFADTKRNRRYHTGGGKALRAIYAA